jgi:hypothetical protein
MRGVKNRAKRGDARTLKWPPFYKLDTTINRKSAWTMEGESGRRRGWGGTCRGDAMSSVRSSN